MHPNPVYRDNDQSRALLTARERGFGIVTVQGPDGILASHIPFLLETTRLAAHLVRSNPISRLLRDGPVEALMIVQGPDAYISPDWYGVEDQVPTWNYVAVHLRGQLRLLPDAALPDHVAALSATNEAHLLPKKIWTMDKMTPGVAERMMRGIVAVEMTVREIDSTFKLAQNKPAAARRAAADALEGSARGFGQPALANLMRTADEH